MLYKIIQSKNGKQKVKMVDSLQQCYSRLKQLRHSTKGTGVLFWIEKTDETQKINNKIGGR